MHITFALTAGQRVEFFEPGDFFRLMAATAAINVEYYREGREIAEAEAVSVGYAEEFKDGGFDRFVIVNGATAQTVTVASRNGSRVQYDTPPNGQVTVTNNSGNTWTQVAKTITSTSSLLVGSNPNRRYVLLQNNSTTGAIFLQIGSTATLTTGIKIEPGGSYEMNGFVCTNALHCIGDIASNPNVVFVENT